jgi:hypothetical protein
VDTQNYLNEEFGEEDKQALSSSSNREINITWQKKLKYFTHWTIIVVVHLQIFWSLPIAGNMKLYGSPYCSDGELGYDYGCFNFHSSLVFICYYCLWVLYLYYSS